MRISDWSSDVCSSDLSIAQWTMDAAVALVQTGLVYRKPSLRENGRQILGFYPPPRALESGYGDCDTKAALLAAILQNLTDAPIIGVHVPKHYLLGIGERSEEHTSELQSLMRISYAVFC